MAEETINTDGGASIKGDVNTGGGDVNGRDNVEGKATGNVVNIYSPVANSPVPRKQRQPTPKQGGLMADAAQELWKTIGDLKETLGSLKTSVDTNTRATDKLAEKQSEAVQRQDKLIEEQGRRSEEQFEAFGAQILALQRLERAIRGMGIQVPDADHALPTKSSPWWQPYLTPIILTLIFLFLISFAAFGGHWPW